MEERLFIYGTLRQKSVQKEVIGRIVKLMPDILEGYKKSSIIIDNEKYPVIVQSKDSFTKGFVIFVTPKELKLVDKYETNAYKRKKVLLRSKKDVWTYIK